MSSAAAPASPSQVAAPQRIGLLDALRGFALLGILLANVHYFAGWMFLDPDGRAALAGAAVAKFEGFLFLLLIDGKFYSLFSLLFGIGFALQLQRLQQRSAHATRIYLRRLLALLLIGLVHLCLIWDGDILTLYALIGVLLLPLRRCPDRALPGIAAGLILLPVVGWAALRLAGIDPSFGLQAYADAQWADLTRHSGLSPVDWLAQPDWLAAWAWIQSGPLYRIAYLLESWRLPKVLGVMLLGLWVGRRLSAGLLDDRRWLRRIALGGLALGLPANALYAGLGGLQQDAWLPGIAAQVAYAFGVVPLAAAYAALFALLLPYVGRGAATLAAAGRMALTNYLAQSLICIGLFYGVGLGLVGQLAPPAFYAIALSIFALQLLFSRVWLARFEQGPAERLWRWLTYGRAGSRDG